MAGGSPPLGSDAQIRLFVDTVQEYAIFMVTPDGMMASWNAGVGRILGYTADEFLGLPTSQLFSPEDIERGIPEHEMRTAAEAGRAENERWHVRKDGTR